MIILLLILSLFSNYSEVPYNLIPNYQKRDCNIKIDFAPFNASPNSSMEGKLILKSTPKGLAVYGEVKNIQSGVYQLEVTDLPATDTSSNLSGSKSYASKKVLKIYVKEGMDKGRTVIRDTKRSCDDAMNMQNKVIIIRHINIPEKPIVLISKF